MIYMRSAARLSRIRKEIRHILACWRLRASNPIEHAIQQKIKRRAIKVQVFPNEAELERLISALLVEIDDNGAIADKAYIKLNRQDD